MLGAATGAEVGWNFGLVSIGTHAIGVNDDHWQRAGKIDSLQLRAALCHCMTRMQYLSSQGTEFSGF